MNHCGSHMQRLVSKMTGAETRGTGVLRKNFEKFNPKNRILIVFSFKRSCLKKVVYKIFLGGARKQFQYIQTEINYFSYGYEQQTEENGKYEESSLKEDYTFSEFFAQQ